jgi:hypothetical protein
MAHVMKKQLAGLSGVIGVAVWLFLFGLGLLIDSKPYRTQLSHAFEWKPFLLCLLTFTPTNVAALCLLAAFCGGCASRLIFSEAASALGVITSDAKTEVSDSQIYMGESPVSSMLRGFLVYIAYLAGVYITSDIPFDAPTVEQYARAAGATSLVAFVVGYDPTIFRTLISLGSKFNRN